MSILRDLLPRKPPPNSESVRQSDALVDAARQLLADGRAEEALEALRQARQLTPMRDDIRRLAERAIEIRTRRLASPLARQSASTLYGQAGTARPAMPGLIVPTEPVERTPPSKTRASRRKLETRSVMEEAAANTPLPVRTSGRPRRPSQPPPRERTPAPSGRRSPMPQPRSLEERRLPRLNLLAWLALIGVAGIVMIGSSAILHTGTNTLFSVEDTDQQDTGIPDEVREQISEARRELREGEPLRAVARLQLAIDRWPEQKRELNSVLARAYAARGDSLRADRSYERAAEAFASAADLAPRDASLRASQGESLYMAARTAQDRKETSTAKKLYGESIIAYEKALAVEPHNAEASLGRGKVHAAQDQRKEAVASFKDVIEHHPGTEEAREAAKMLDMLTGGRH